MNSVLQYLLHTVILLFLSISLWGQLDMGIDSVRHIEYIRSIKQFGEFVDRFNQDSFELPDLDPEHSLVLDRRQSLLLLFNRNDPRFDRSNPLYSEEYVALVLEFIDDIVENKIYLDKHSDQIKAMVSTSILYKDRSDTVQIILKQEVDAPNLVRWVIHDVDADFLKIPERDTTQLRFLSPVSHELGFMDLKKAFDEPEHVVDYTREDFKFDRLSVFLKWIAEGYIDIKEVVEVEYRVNIPSASHPKGQLQFRILEINGYYILDLI